LAHNLPSRDLKDANICTWCASGLLFVQRAGATLWRKAMTDSAKMSLRSPATIWAAFATFIYSACGRYRSRHQSPWSVQPCTTYNRKTSHHSKKPVNFSHATLCRLFLVFDPNRWRWRKHDRLVHSEPKGTNDRMHAGHTS
jgi:hypothetical protein